MKKCFENKITNNQIFFCLTNKPGIDEREIHSYHEVLLYLSGNLDIKSLTEIMHISPSGITHIFKKEFGIPIHKYIMQKRLVYAKRLVKSGEQLSKIYADAGFKDYSSFYKAYTNYFGYAPSEDKGKKDNIKSIEP